MERIQIISILISLGLLVMVLHLIATRRLRIQYSVVWLITCFMLLILSVWRSLLHKVANLVGIYYPPSLLFLMGFIFSLTIILHFSLFVSQLFEKNKELAQRLSILTLRVEALEKDRGFGD